MAVAFVRGKWTGNEAGKEINLTGEEIPAANNTLVVFVSDAGKTTKPKVSDDKDGETGWVGSETSALGNESKGSFWVFVKAKAKGTEEKITATVVGTQNSVEYAEISGSTGAIDNIQAFNNVGGAVAVKAFTVEGVTTNEAASITFVAMGNCAASSNGAAEAWTGGPPTLKNPTTAVGRGYYGYEIPGAKIESKSFTGSHATARKEVAVLAVSFKAATSETFAQTIAQTLALSQVTAGQKVAASTVTQLLGELQKTAATKVAAAAIVQRLGELQTTAATKSTAATLAQLLGVRQSASATKVTTAAVAQRAGLGQSTAATKVATGSVAQRTGLLQQILGGVGVESFQAAIAQSFALKQTFSGRKTATGQVAQKLGLVQSLGEVQPFIRVLTNLVLAYVPAKQPAIAEQIEPLEVAADVPASGTHTVHDK